MGWELGRCCCEWGLSGRVIAIGLDLSDFMVFISGAGLYLCLRLDDLCSDSESSVSGDVCNASDWHCHRCSEVTAVDSDVCCNFSYAVT